MNVLPRGLRARSAAAFALLGLVLSVVMSVATYQLARWYLLDQRESLAARQAELHAQVLAGELSGEVGLTDDEVIAGLARTRSRAVLLLGESWYSTVVALNESRVPAAMVDGVRSGEALQQRVKVGGAPYFVVGVPLPTLGGGYFEFVPALEYERTLRTLAYVLVAVATVTTGIGALAGWSLSRRVIRPLNTVAETAQAMSSGDLHQRLDVGDDPDLRPVAASFNTMAESLEERIARERRFTADVSHELRTPLTAMSSAVALAQRAQSQERTTLAIDMLANQVDHLRRLTLELLELARIDAGREEVEPSDRVDVGLLVTRQAELHGVAHLVTYPELSVMHEVNSIRFERVVANLLENATRYGGGATHIDLHHISGTLRLLIDDDGPGVPPEEREAIFDRFHRGAAESRPGHPKGTGLGLSLVDEFVRLEGGQVWVEEAPSGGARFVVEVPSRS